MRTTLLPTIVCLSLSIYGCTLFKTEYVASPFRFPPANTTLGRIDTVWQLYKLNGDSIQFSMFKGKKIFINYWATWCAPCIAEMPHLQTLYNNKRSDTNVVFLFISNEEQDVIQSFISSKKYSFPLYRSNVAPNIVKADGYPTTFIFNSKGDLVYTRLGYSLWQDSSVVKFIDGLP